MATRRVVHPVLTARLGTPTQSEESRAFLQQRIGFSAEAAFFVSTAFLVVLSLVEIARGGGLQRVFAPEHVAHVGVNAVLGAVWAVCARARIPPRALVMLDALVMLLILSGFAAIAFVMPHHGASQYPMILAATHVLIMRAVIVPSTWWHTFVTGLIATIPLEITTHIVAKETLAQLGSEVTGAVIINHGLLWCTSGVVIASITSRVIYGLQQQVEQAKQLGQYTLIDKIAEGGMGVVYRASHALLRRPTAIKLLRPEDAGEANLARFEREVQLTAKLTHPNTIAIFDYGRTPDGVFYYAMEYLDGVTLEDLVVNDGPQPPARVIHILRQVCGALAEAHQIGLIHRDIKPANIILCERGGVPDVVKVLDFGLVKDIASNEALTHADALTGTPLYLCPEVIKAPRSADSRGDLYAVGAVGYYLLAGRHVFEGGSVLEVCSHHLHTVPVPPSKRLGRPLPADLEGLVLSCLEKDPGARPADARTLAAALAACDDAGGWSESDAIGWWKTGRRTKRNGDSARPEPPGLSATIPVDLARRAERD